MGQFSIPILISLSAARLTSSPNTLPNTGTASSTGLPSSAPAKVVTLSAPNNLAESMQCSKIFLCSSY